MSGKWRLAPNQIDRDEIDLIRRSPLFDADWYCRRYPDVIRLGLEPAVHFARIGAALGRDPGPGFSTRHYLTRYPDVAAAGGNAFVHYLRRGRSEGRAPHPAAVPPLPAGAQATLALARGLLETGGLSAGPLAALERLTAERNDSAAAAVAATAAEALALWALARGDGGSAARWLDQRLAIGRDKATRTRLAPLQAIATGALSPEMPASTDLYLAATRIETDPAARVARLNQALASSGLDPVRLLEEGPQEGAQGAAFDRLRGPDMPPEGEGGPLISVLMAAHDATATIATAIRSVQAQSWRNFELLIIDDASGDETATIAAAAAAGDPRIRFLRLAQNRGAYGARNAGLAQARGDYITLHDADDWSHPARLARQIRFLTRHRGYAGCLTTQARVTPDLRLSRWTGEGRMMFENMTSLMLPTALMRDCLGGWDNVRVSADSELARRVRHLFGAAALPLLDGGPLALQRDTTDSATGHSATGMGWFYYGARREYYEAQQACHAAGDSLFYSAAQRPFAVPAILRPNAEIGAETGAEQAFDVIYAGVLTGGMAGLETLLEQLDDDAAAGRRAGLVPLYSMQMPAAGGLAIHPALRARIDGDRVAVLCYGERARCSRFVRLPDQPGSDVAHRYLPVIREGARVVLEPGDG